MYKSGRQSRISHRIVNPYIENEVRKSLNQRQEDQKSLYFQEIKLQLLKSFASNNQKPIDTLHTSWFINSKTSKQSL